MAPLSHLERFYWEQFQQANIPQHAALVKAHLAQDVDHRLIDVRKELIDETTGLIDRYRAQQETDPAIDDLLKSLEAAHKLAKDILKLDLEEAKDREDEDEGKVDGGGAKEREEGAKIGQTTVRHHVKVIVRRRESEGEVLDEEATVDGNQTEVSEASSTTVRAMSQPASETSSGTEVGNTPKPLS